MRPRPFLLIAGVALALMAAGEAEAKGPEWSHGTGNDVRTVAISADGEYIAVGSDDYNVYLFDKNGSGSYLWAHQTEYEVYSVSISADGAYIAAGSRDNKVYLFDKDSSTPLWSYEAASEVYSVTISADGEYIAAGSGDARVYLFDKDSSTPLWSYTTGDYVSSVAISADGEYIAAGSRSNKVLLFDKDSSTPLWSYSTENDVVSVAISADGEYIAAGSYDNKVYLFDKDSSTPLWNYETGEEFENRVSVAISVDGEYITAGSYDNKVYLFDKDSSTPLWSYTTGGTVYSVAISADGEYIAVGSGDNKVYLFGKDNSTQLWNYTTGSYVSSVAISADGEYIAAGSKDNAVYLFLNNLPPTATIDSIVPSPARFDAEIFFSGSGSDSDGTVVAYEWISSRDGFLSDEEDFSITGLDAVTHTISFRVQDNDGEWSGWDTAVLVFIPNAPPVATIESIEPSPAEEGTPVFFNGTGSDSDGAVATYLWESSIDGELNTEANFSSSNLSCGYHTIRFLVQDNEGAWSDTRSESLFVFAYPVAIAGADVSTTPTVPVQFNGQGTDVDGTIVKYEWDFDGNGVYEWSSTENGRELNLYNNVGVYTAMLRVTDNDGFTDTDTVVITVTEKIVLIDDDGTVTVEEGEGGIPAPSLAVSVAAVAVIALRRRPRKP